MELLLFSFKISLNPSENHEWRNSLTFLWFAESRLPPCMFLWKGKLLVQSHFLTISWGFAQESEINLEVKTSWHKLSLFSQTTTKKCPKLSLSSRKKISFLKTFMERVTKTFPLQDLPIQRLYSSSFSTESSSWTFLMLPWGTVSNIDNKLNFCCEEVYKVYFVWLSSLASDIHFVRGP